MASKLLLAAMPTNTSFFKLQVSDGEFVKDEQLDKQIRSEVDLAMSLMEQIVLQHVEASNDRQVFFNAFRHLVCTGNVLLFDHDHDPIQLFPLNRYVVERDGNGNWLEIVTVEAVDRRLLPEEFQEERQEDLDFKPGPASSGAMDDVTAEEGEVLVYTYVTNDGKRVEWYQEADGKVIPGSRGSAKADASPWFPLRFNVIDGNAYGCGRIEEYLGDLSSLNSLMQLMVEGTAATTKTLWMVAPSAMISSKALAEASNNAVLPGREGDVTVVRADKGGDFQVSQALVADLTQRLNEAFLVFSPRQSERTTAEEIRAMQQELNEQLGGQLGNIQTDLLQPYLKRRLTGLQSKGKLPKLPKDVVFPTVVTGLSSIGRGQDVQAIMLFMQTIAQSVGPEAIAQHINTGELLKRLAAGSGIDPTNLVKTDEELQSEQQAQQEAAQQQSLTDQAGQFAAAQVKQQEVMNNAQAQASDGGDAAGGAQAGPQ